MKETIEALMSPTLRGLISQLNKESIEKSDIVQIFHDGERYVAIFYK